MTFETKYNVDDKVWIYLDGKVREFPIQTIDIRISKKEIETKYYLNVGTKDDYKCHLISEDKCFATKEELIKSLD